MKKMTTLLAGLLLSLSSSAQFVPPVYPETIYPTAAMNALLRPQHTSCYEMNNITAFGVVNNFYLYTWNASGSGGSSTLNGIAWRRTAPGGAMPLYDFGYHVIPGDIYDLEAVFVQLGGAFYIVATYYHRGVGHKYEIYTWNAAGISYFTGGTLSTSATYGRISLDAHRLYGVAVTWEVAGRIYVKALNTSSGTWTIGNTIEVGGVTAGAIPDVAFSHAGELNVRIAYVNASTGDIHVAYRDFPTLLVASGVLGFALEDINPASFPSTIAIDPYKSNNLQLDCPDHYPEENWSYIYTDDEINVNTRIRTIPLGTFTVNLSASTAVVSSDNKYLTIAYAPGGTRIHYGWYTSYTSWTPVPGYVATERNDDGTFVSPPLPGWLKIVANTTAYSSMPFMSFSKQNDASANLFVVYPMHGVGGSGYEIRFKNNVPWSATSYKPAPEEEAALSGMEVEIGPNPFSTDLKIMVPNDKNYIYDVFLSDISGRVLLNIRGNLTRINEQLKALGSAAYADGIYSLKIQSDDAKINRMVKLVKKQ